MSVANQHQNGVKVTLVLPPDVVGWLDRRAAAVYKSRTRFLRDLVIGGYRKEKEKESE